MIIHIRETLSLLNNGKLWSRDKTNKFKVSIMKLADGLLF